jgi:hypothetical protein
MLAQVCTGSGGSLLLVLISLSARPRGPQLPERQARRSVSGIGEFNLTIQARQSTLDPLKPHDSEEESSDNSSGPGNTERTPPIFQHVQQLPAEHTTLASNIDGQDILPYISVLVRRLSEEAADPALPADIILRISRISPTESFRKPLNYPTQAPQANQHKSSYGISRDCLRWRADYTPGLMTNRPGIR